MMIVKRISVGLTVCGLMAFVGGCDIGGGASVIPNVTVKLSESDDTETGPGPGPGPGVKSTGGGPGTLKGKVVFEGAVPKLADLIAKGGAGKDPEVCAADNAIPNESLIVGDGNGVKNVFIYLSKAPKGAPKTEMPSEPAIFDQKGCQFLPHCLLLRKGQKLKILSDDPIAHNTHTFPAKNSSFNAGIKAGDREGTEIVYASSESKPFAVKCDYHSWMNAYHLPLDHPYGAISGDDGSFEIKDVPSGKHNFVIWHEGAKGGYLQRKYSVTIKAGETTEVSIPYPAGKFGN